MAGKARIDIDGYNLALRQGTGIATYGRTLAAALGEMGAEVNGLYGLYLREREDALVKEMRFFDPAGLPRKSTFHRQQVVRVLKGFAGLKAFEIPLTGKVVPNKGDAAMFRHVWNIDCLFHTARDYFDLTGRTLTVEVPDPPQVMHWTYPVPIAVKGAKNIYTLHDLVPLRLPYTTLDRKDRYLSLMRLLAREADLLVTVSEQSKRDIVGLLEISEDRVFNTYQAALPPPADNPGLRRGIEASLGLSDGYFLFVGAIEPKKNVGRLVEAFLAADPKAKLILVGKKAWQWETEIGLAELAAQGPGGRITHLDYLPFPTLAALMRGAKAVCFPSLYEGFGLPVLEALQLGAPVITAKTGSLPEVAGEAALMVDPYDTAAITQAIKALDTDPKLRARLSRAGLAQAKKFSLAAYKVRLAELYRRVGAAV